MVTFDLKKKYHISWVESQTDQALIHTVELILLDKDGHQIVWEWTYPLIHVRASWHTKDMT